MPAQLPRSIRITERFAVVGLLALFGVALGLDWYCGDGNPVIERTNLPLFVWVGMAGPVVGLWLRYRRLRVVRRAMTYQGRVCVRCSYPLVNLPAQGTCPECGVHYQLEANEAIWANAHQKLRWKPW